MQTHTANGRCNAVGQAVYWTFRVKGNDSVDDPAVAVKVSVYVPGGVPPGADPPEPGDPEEPPPQEIKVNAAITTIISIPNRRNLRRLSDIGATNSPKIAVAHNQCMEEPGKTSWDLLEVAVLTVTEKFDTILVSTVTVAGAEQTAYAGAPAQAIIAVPPMPPPPMLTVYVAVPPAVTVAFPELPGALSPKVAAPTPVKGMTKGIEAFPEIVKVPE